MIAVSKRQHNVQPEQQLSNKQVKLLTFLQALHPVSYNQAVVLLIIDAPR